MMQILGIVCSPRKNSNTEILVTQTLKSARKYGAEVEIVSVVGKNINPCDGCDSCTRAGKCKIDDDMQGIYSKMLLSDGIVIGSPVYYWDVCAQAKIIIDRTYRFREHRELRNKVGAAIVVASQAGASIAFNTLLGFFNIQKMTLARSYGPLNKQELADERTGGVIAYARDRGAIKENERALAQADALGKAIVETIELCRNGRG